MYVFILLLLLLIYFIKLIQDSSATRRTDPSRTTPSIHVRQDITARTVQDTEHNSHVLEEPFGTQPKVKEPRIVSRVLLVLRATKKVSANR